MFDTSDRIRAIERAIDVLECFAAERRTLSIGDLEKAAKLSRPTLYRILATLIARGLVRKDGEPPRYRLDIGVARLADVWANSLDVVQLAMPILNRLLEQHDETVALYLRILKQFPNVLGAPLDLAAIYSRLGREAEARAAAAEVLRINPNFSLEVHKQRMPIKDPAMLERYIAALQKAGLK